MKQLKIQSKLLAALIALGMFTSCGSDDGEPDVDATADNKFNVVATIDDVTYLAPTEDLTTGSLSFQENGRELDAVRAARVISSGDYVYSLNYGTGVITQLQPNSEGGYNVIKELNAGAAVGTEYPRYKLANDNTIMIYNVEVADVTDSTGTVIDKTCTMKLASIAIPELNVSYIEQFEIPQTENATQGGTVKGYHPFRVDATVISDSKIYFGLMHNDQFQGGRTAAAKPTGLETLVFDFPTLTNGKIVQSDAGNGHTNGYRAPSMHVDENGDVYQVNLYMTGFQFDLSGGDKTVITRLKNGDYDDSYVFNVSEALGETGNIGTAGWFYVGNGIGYMPIQLEDEGAYYGENSWKVARVDIYNKTAVMLNVPFSDLLSCENGITNDGKFYMAISPYGGESYIYEFDPTSTSPDAFEKGLKLDGDNVYVEGVY